MKKFYLTFGYNTPNRHHYQVVNAPDESTARTLVWEVHGKNWAFLYDEVEKPDAIDSYGLQSLPNELSVPVVACRLCGQPTPAIKTLLCDPCWRVERYVTSYPDIARKILEEKQ